MATSQKLTSHFLTCSVCLEVFTNPCTLPCDHTFCTKCVVTYIKTRPDAVTARSVPCPFCKRLTKVHDPRRPVEEWVDQFKPSLLLLGLMDTIGPESKDTTNCNLCHDGGETTPATTWCSACDVSLCDACLKVHGRMPSTRHHVTSDLSGELKVKGRRRAMCQEHKDEYIKFYCKDCKKTLCQSCCIVYHRKCESVITLESMLPEIRTTLGTRKETLVKTIHDVIEQLDSRKSRRINLQQTKSSIQFKIRATAQKAMDAIKKKEKQLMDDLDDITDRQMDQLKSDIKSGDMAIQIYKQQSEFIDQVLNSDSEVDMYDLYQSCESGAVHVESVVDKDVSDRGARTRIEFSHDMDKMNKALDELPLGEIKFIHTFNDWSTPPLSKRINCRTTGDKEKPTFEDLIYIDVHGTDTLIVTDFRNRCVKSFFDRNQQACQSRVVVKGIPRRIAKLEGKRFAVTVPKSRAILIFRVTPDLSLLSSIPTSKQYSGLTALNTTLLAAGSESPPGVDILDMSGKVLQSISPLIKGQEIIRFPDFLKTTRNNNLLVSDFGTKSVLCLTTQGDVVFNFSPTSENALFTPFGITSTDTGDILVADNSGKVIQLSDSGKFVRDILRKCDGLQGPVGLDYNENGHIYVTHNSGDIQVYTFK